MMDFDGWGICLLGRNFETKAVGLIEDLETLPFPLPLPLSLPNKYSLSYTLGKTLL
jgi:hypothetical protein